MLDKLIHFCFVFFFEVCHNFFFGGSFGKDALSFSRFFESIQNEFKTQEWGHVALEFDKLYIEYVQYQNPLSIYKLNETFSGWCQSVSQHSVVLVLFSNLTWLSFGRTHYGCYQPGCVHMSVSLFRSLWDSHESLGRVVFDGSCLFLEWEPYAAAPNTAVLSKERMRLLLTEFLANVQVY